MDTRFIQVALLLLLECVQAGASPLQLITTEVPLGGESWRPDYMSDDWRRVAAIVQSRTNAVVYIDTQPPQEYDAAASIDFSPDSKQAVYVAFRNQKAFLVVNGREGNRFDDIGYKINAQNVSPFFFSPDSRHLACVVREGFYQKVIVDDQEGKQFYERIDAGTVLFSPNSQHLAYIGRRNTLKVVNLDSNELTTTDDAQAPTFSPDGKHFAYIILRDQRWHVIFDGEESPAWDEIKLQRNFPEGTDLPPMAFSADSRHFAYEARRGPESFIVVDGHVVAHGLVHSLIFGPNGRTAYIEDDLRDQFHFRTRVVVDGVAGKLSEGRVRLLTFASNSSEVVCLRHIGDETQDPGTAILSVNDQVTHRYQEIDPDSLRFSADGKHMGFLGGNEKQVRLPGWVEEKLGREPEGPKDGYRFYIVIDRKVETMDAKELDHVDFAPDLSRWGCVYKTETNQYAIVDGKGMGPYQYIVPFAGEAPRISFSPDGRHYAFEACKEDDTCVLVVDGLEKAINGEWGMQELPLVFDTPTHLRGLFWRTVKPGLQRLIRLEVDLVVPKQ
jgi:hypothetical protein